MSPLTVSGALAELGREGVLVSRPGAGTFVAAQPRGGRPADPADYSWQTVTLAELAERFQIERSAARDVLARAHRLGLLVPVGGDRYEVPAPGLLAAAEEAVRRGIPLPAAIAVIEELDRHSDEVARGFVRLFLKEVWAPFVRADMPESRWAELEEATERLRPLASEAVLAIFHRRLTAQIEAAFGEIAEAMAEARDDGR